MKKFENRETVVKGFIINTVEQTFTPFEETTSYVRSTDKAIEKIRELMHIENSPEIVVTVNEVINEKAKPIKYNDGKIYDLCYNYMNDKEAAEAAAEVDGNICKKISWYEYSCQYWAIDSDGNYHTDYFADNSPLNMTKCDMRAFLKIACEDYIGMQVLALHNCEKVETNLYCLITRENLDKCVER